MAKRVVEAPSFTVNTPKTKGTRKGMNMMSGMSVPDDIFGLLDEEVPEGIDPEVWKRHKERLARDGKASEIGGQGFDAAAEAVPVWGQLAKFNKQLAGKVSNEDEFGVAKSNTSAMAGDVLDPFSSTMNAVDNLFNGDGKFEASDIARFLPGVGGIMERKDAKTAKGRLLKEQDNRDLLKKIDNRNSYFTSMYSNNYADGGKITGPGTAKSDSIATKMPTGAFVVPAENAKEALALGKEALGWNRKSKAKRGGDQNVNLSNGEVVFMPEEVKMLTEMGIDLTALAPNATGGKNLFAGGPVTPEQKQAIADTAKRLGLTAQEFTAILLQESSLDPKSVGGAGNRHEGLIHWGPSERSTELVAIAKKHGIKYDGDIKKVPFEKQLKLAEEWMKSRGFKPGEMNAQQAYATILGGNPYAKGKDENGTQAGNNPNIAPGGKFYKQAEQITGKGQARSTENDIDFENLQNSKKPLRLPGTEYGDDSAAIERRLMNPPPSADGHKQLVDDIESEYTPEQINKMFGDKSTWEAFKTLKTPDARKIGQEVGQQLLFDKNFAIVEPKAEIQGPEPDPNKFQFSADDLISANQNIPPIPGQVDRAPITPELMLPTSKETADATNSTATDPENKFSIADTNWGTVASVAQMAYGAYGLAKLGDRPEDKITDDFANYLNEIQTAEAVGLTPQEWASGKDNIQSIRNNDLAAVKELVGGDAGLAMASILESGNRATAGMVDLTTLDSRLKADDRQAIRGQRANAEFFNENRNAQINQGIMSEYDRNRDSYANLLNAGVGNFIGSQDPLYKQYRNQYKNHE